MVGKRQQLPLAKRRVIPESSIQATFLVTERISWCSIVADISTVMWKTLCLNVKDRTQEKRFGRDRNVQTRPMIAHWLIQHPNLSARTSEHVKHQELSSIFDGRRKTSAPHRAIGLTATTAQRTRRCNLQSKGSIVPTNKRYRHHLLTEASQALVMFDFWSSSCQCLSSRSVL